MRRFLASAFLCACYAMATAGGDAVAVETGYASRAGAVLGTYSPALPDRSPEAMARAEATSAELVAPAKAAYDQAWEHARAVFDEAHAAYTIEIFESLGGKGDYAAETNARWISASNQASSLANKVATPAYEAASRAEKELNEARNRADRLRIEIAQPVRDTYEAAYYDAYVHPEPGWTADVAGYDRDIVLELAAAERERYCPPWRGRGFRLR